MSAGNIFALLLNDSATSALLNATDTLVQRLGELQNLRPSAAMAEISRTHSVFIESTWEPFAAMAYTYFRITEKAGILAFGNEITYTVPQYGTWIGDMVLHLRLAGLRAADPRDKVRWYARPGHRIMERVTFLVNNTEIASYSAEEYNKHLAFHVSPRKLAGYLRGVGQETPRQGYLIPDPRVDEYREMRWYADGAQTPKQTQPALDMYVPLLFWFNRNIAQAFPNVRIPMGNVQVRIRFAAGATMWQGADYGGGGAVVPATISVADLYVNHINTLPQIERLIMRGYDLMLIRVPRSIDTVLTESSGSVLLQDIKYLVEHFAVAFRPLINEADADAWYRNQVLAPQQIIVPACQLDTSVTPPVPIFIANYATYNGEDNVIDNMGMRVENNDFFPTETVGRYAGHASYAAPGLNTPDDAGWLLLNMQMRPDLYNPSGFIDMLRNREVYINYASSYITHNTRARMIVHAQCINFMVLQKNSAFLKYV